MKIVMDQVSQGVKSIYGEELYQKELSYQCKSLKKLDFNKVDYQNWTKDEDKNEMIADYFTITILKLMKK
jgi:hypothetical protein